MGKEIQYPTSDWLEKYINKHGCALEDAEVAWWDAQIDKGNPTPFDLDAEQEKAVKEITKGMAKSQKAVDAFGKTRTRERKPNPNKRDIIAHIFSKLKNIYDDVTVSNIERSIDFRIGDKDYTITLTEHRKPKNAG